MTSIDPGSRRALAAAFICALALAVPAQAETDAASEAAGDLAELSLEDLMDVRITSASKREQKLSETPAAIYVITNEEIRRSGLQTLPEVLRLVPGLHVAQIDANKWAITSRGFNNQFANKLLVLIDGRSVYTPMFSGVYWDMQDVMLEDVERIEVIRGPGGAVWGANAVNGVINIITKSSRDTQGALLASQSGLGEYFGGAARWGGMAGEEFSYRAYLKGGDRQGHQSTLAGRDQAKDDWQQIRTGMRTEWTPTTSDLVTLQGDFYDGESGEEFAVPLGTTNDDIDVLGGNALARWTHTFSETHDVGAQIYYDRTEHSDLVASEDRDTVDLELKHSFVPIARNRLIWGGGYRFTNSDVQDVLPIITFTNAERADNLYNIFLQNELTVVEGLLALTAGSKFEHNDYTGWEIQPTGRFTLTPHEDHTVWGGVSRAVRSPSRIESNLAIPALPQGIDLYAIAANPNQESENVLAFELGYRAQPLSNVTLDLAGYYNQYEDLRTFEITGPGVPLGGGAFFFPAQWGNGMNAEGWGTELAANWRPLDILKLTATYTWMGLDTDSKSFSTDTQSLRTKNDTPDHLFSVRSWLDLPWGFELDSQLFYVDEVENQLYFKGSAANSKTIDEYVRLDLRLAWKPREGAELALVGQNLTSDSHVEYGNGFFNAATAVPRTFYGKVTWRY